MINLDEFKKLFSEMTNFKENDFHPLVWILGDVEFGKDVKIGGLSEINGTGAHIYIGDNCDIASFVSINCSDSHMATLGIDTKIDRKNIIIENNVFIGSHSVIKGGVIIGHNSVVAAGTIVDGAEIPPYSLVFVNPMEVKSDYYRKLINSKHLKLNINTNDGI